MCWSIPFARRSELPDDAGPDDCGDQDRGAEKFSGQSFWQCVRGPVAQA